MTRTRYEGRAFLRLLELYVLHTIRALPAKDALNFESMAPKLRALYGKEGTCYEVIAAVMELDERFEEHVRSEWTRAQVAGVSADQFSCMVADKLIE